jgi:hypothetical protein
LPRFEVAAGIVFEIRLVTAQPKLPNVEFARTEIRNQNAGVVAALAADSLATRQRIDPSETGAVSNGAVDPSSV